MREIGMICFWLIAVAAASSRGVLASEDTARNALEVQGYSDVQINYHAWFAVEFRGCGTSDAARFDATAKNPAGRTVQVYVCTGWPLKGSTIRT